MTDSFPRLTRAPITEALIGIGVDTTGLAIEQVDAAYETFREEFPRRQSRTHHHLALPSEDSSFQGSTRTIGWTAWSADNRRALQGRLDGFAYSRLPPYADWAELRAGAHATWAGYVEHVKPREVNRLAVRYINRIDLEQPVPRFEDYFRTFPQLGPALPQAYAGFFVRLLIPVDEVMASITLTIDADAVSDLVVPVVLDIEAFIDIHLAPMSGEVWAILDRLRDVKNRVFFGSITETLEARYR